MLYITQQPAYLCLDSMILTPLRLMQKLQPLCALNKQTRSCFCSTCIIDSHESWGPNTRIYQSSLFQPWHLAIFYQKVQHSAIVEPKILALFSAVAAIEKRKMFGLGMKVMCDWNRNTREPISYQIFCFYLLESSSPHGYPGWFTMPSKQESYG